MDTFDFFSLPCPLMPQPDGNPENSYADADERKRRASALNLVSPPTATIKENYKNSR
jgi:hypothetical protein